jgi:hypothetical protein
LKHEDGGADYGSVREEFEYEWGGNLYTSARPYGKTGKLVRTYLIWGVTDAHVEIG